PDHVRPVAEDGDLGAGLGGPVDGDLRHPKAAPLREEQELYIKAEADRLELTKEHRGHLGSEELEAALRVRHVGESQAPDEKVEHLPRKLPVQANLASDGR